MSNGRRTWRRFVRYERANPRDDRFLWRLREEGADEDFKVFYYGPANSVGPCVGFARRHQALLGIESVASRPIAPRPFSVRSLVGMSQRRRKQLADLEFCDILEDAINMNRAEDPEALQARMRSKYRIGERLRPCPGCPSCSDGPDACPPSCDKARMEHCAKSGIHCDRHCICDCVTCRAGHGDLACCDSSGLLPAKRANTTGAKSI